MKIILTFLVLIGFISPQKGLATVIKLKAQNNREASGNDNCDHPSGNCSGTGHC